MCRAMTAAATTGHVQRLVQTAVQTGNVGVNLHRVPSFFKHYYLQQCDSIHIFVCNFQLFN